MIMRWGGGGGGIFGGEGRGERNGSEETGERGKINWWTGRKGGKEGGRWRRGEAVVI